MVLSERDLIKAQIPDVLGSAAKDSLVRKIEENPALLRKLQSARANPVWIQHLLREIGVETAPRHATALVAKAFSAQTEYALSRFEQATGDEFARRWNACQSCTHLVQNPGGILYFLGKAIFRSDDDRVCNLCGCPASAKAARMVERCPAPADCGTINRWGQPMDCSGLICPDTSIGGQSTIRGDLHDKATP
jgi:hypothetical protein